MSVLNQTLRLIFFSECQRKRIFSVISTTKCLLQHYSSSLASTSTERKTIEENNTNIYTPTVGKGLRIAIIGCSNVGKSALTNALIRAPICAVSKLVDTTRANTTTSLTEEQCQLVIVDSPGLVSLSHAKEVIGTHSEDRILTHPEKAIERAEQIIVVHDATSKGEYLQHRILYILHRYMHIPACLVVNKVDLVERRADLLKLTEILTDGTVGGEKIQKKAIDLGIVGSLISKAKNDKNKNNLSNNNDEFLNLHPLTTKERDENWYSLYNKILSKPLHKASWSDTRKLFKEQNGWPHFKAIFFTSAKTNEGVDTLRKYLREHSIDKKWSFAPQTNSRLICAEHVRSALLDNCPSHIAYKLRVAVTEWEFDEQLPINEQILRVAVNVFCENEREARQVWYKMEEIENTINQQLKQLYCRNVLFSLFIRVKDKGGIYQPNEKAEEQKRLIKAEIRRKKKEINC